MLNAFGGAGNQWQISYQNGAGLRGNHTFVTNSVARLSTPIHMNDSLWHRVVWVREGTGANAFKLYLDGVNVRNGTVADDLSSVHRFGIASPTGGGNYTLDEFIIYNDYAFTPQEVLNDYAGSINLTYPINNDILINSTINFTSTFSEQAGGTISNATIYLYEDGTLFNSTTRSYSGNSNTSTFEITGFSSGTYTWGVQWCNILNECEISDNSTLYWNPLTEIRVTDANGILISSNITINIINYSSLTNPMNDLYLNQYGGNLNHTFTISNPDLLYRNTTISLNPHTFLQYNVTLEANELSLFFYKDGSAQNVNGSIADLNQTFAFFNSSVVLVQSNLTLGPVIATFGSIDIESGNHTQFYEYINTRETDITDNIEILDTAGVTSYFRVTDKSGIPLENAEIEMHSSEPIIGLYVNYSLTSQRLTNPDGETFMYADRGEKQKIIVRLAGYEVYEGLYNLGDDGNGFTDDDPYIIELEKSKNVIPQDTWIFVPNVFFNNTDIIRGTITTQRTGLITITTDYRDRQGTNARPVPRDSYGYADFELVKNTDFEEGVDIILQISVGGTHWNNVTITADTDGKVEALDLDFNLDPNILKPAGILVLILFSFIMGTLFKGGGFNTFMIGAIMLVLVSEDFFFLSFTAGLYYALIIIRRVIEE